MRVLLRIGVKCASAALGLGMMWLSFAPMSPSERAALGDADRFDLVQMRLARVMMTAAPDLTIAGFSAATDLPPDVLEAHLRAKATGVETQPNPAPTTTQPATPNRRIDAGGALFVRPD